MATHDQIAKAAYKIWQTRKAAGDAEADNPQENWRRAEAALNKKELEKTWKLRSPAK